LKFKNKIHKKYHLKRDLIYLSKQTAKPSGSVVFTVVFIIVIFIGCRATPPRLQQSEVNTCFKFTNDLPFEQYIQITRSMEKMAIINGVCITGKTKKKEWHV